MRKRKARVNAIVNVVMFAILLVASVSGILLGIARSGSAEPVEGTPVASQPGRPGGVLHLWIHLHIVTCAVLLALITTHLLLHIPYIKRLPRLLVGSSPRAERDQRQRKGVPGWQRSRTSAGTG